MGAADHWHGPGLTGPEIRLGYSLRSSQSLPGRALTHRPGDRLIVSGSGQGARCEITHHDGHIKTCGSQQTHDCQ